MKVAPAFDAVVWRSLRNSPPLDELLGQCLLVVSNHAAHDLPSGVEQRPSLLLEYLLHNRCLLVLDNFETVLHPERAGNYRPGHEGYGRLLQQVGSPQHQSCILITSREKPKELTPLAGSSCDATT